MEAGDVDSKQSNNAEELFSNLEGDHQ